AGEEVGDGREQVDVVARAVPDERLALGRIEDLSILTRNGVPVPLAQVAKVGFGHEDPILWRRNRDMAITVRSDIVDGVQAPDITAQLLPAIDSIRRTL